MIKEQKTVEIDQAEQSKMKNTIIKKFSGYAKWEMREN